MRNRIIVSDLHFEDSPLAEYRWGIFEAIKSWLEYSEAEYIDFLGDLTEKKDKHSSKLVNRIADEFLSLSQHTDAKIRILKGNHDYIEEKEPFFKFLEQIDNVLYFDEPESDNDTLFLPHSKNFVFPNKIDRHVECIYMHQPVIGAVAQNGYKIEEGCDLTLIRSKAKIYSGDIHSPQDIGALTYVGSPYHVYNGDSYNGRLIYIKDNKEHSVYLHDFPNKHSITLNSILLDDKWNEEFKENDQVKIKIELDKSEYHEWEKIKKMVKDVCEKDKVILTSLEMKPLQNNKSLTTQKDNNNTKLSTKEILDKFAKKENLDASFIEAAYGVMNG